MKKTIIKALSLLTAGCMMLSFAACNSKPEEKTEESKATQESTDSDYAEIDLPQLKGVQKGDTIATIHTSMGDIKVWFFPQYAPKAVENFTTLAKEKRYDNLTFHRVINNFMIQGGDPKGDGTGGQSIWNKPFENEVTPNLRSFRGALCMANAGKDTNGSQFYIVQSPNCDEFLDQYFKILLTGGNAPAKSMGGNEIIDASGKQYTCQEVYTPQIEKAYRENGGQAFLDFDYTIFGQVYEGMDVVDKIAAVETNESDKPLTDVKILSVETGVYE